MYMCCKVEENTVYAYFPDFKSIQTVQHFPHDQQYFPGFTVPCEHFTEINDFQSSHCGGHVYVITGTCVFCLGVCIQLYSDLV